MDYRKSVVLSISAFAISAQTLELVPGPAPDSITVQVPLQEVRPWNDPGAEGATFSRTDQKKSPWVARILEALENDFSGGDPSDEAMARWTYPFTVSEVTGHIRDWVDEAIHFLEGAALIGPHFEAGDEVYLWMEFKFRREGGS
jgi:hypothetical protein